MSLIMFTWNFFHLFANPQWIELNLTSIDSKLLSRCYVTLAPPYLVFWRCYAKPTTSTLATMRICRTFKSSIDSFPLSNIWIVLPNQLPIESCFNESWILCETKDTAAVLWTCLLTSMYKWQDSYLRYLFHLHFTNQSIWDVGNLLLCPRLNENVTPPSQLRLGVDWW